MPSCQQPQSYYPASETHVASSAITAIGGGVGGFLEEDLLMLWEMGEDLERWDEVGGAWETETEIWGPQGDVSPLKTCLSPLLGGLSPLMGGCPPGLIWESQLLLGVSENTMACVPKE